MSNESPLEFDLPDELKMLRDMFVDSSTAKLIPLEGKSLDGQRLKPEIEARLTTRCKELGLWADRAAETRQGLAPNSCGTSICHRPIPCSALSTAPRSRV